jgi:acyl-coenzyme A synthetase/AMP-(fatty) acid ligase
MHPADMVFFWANVDPERLAVISPEMAISYRGLAEAVVSVSERVKPYHLEAAKRPVAVAISDPAKLLAVCFALLRSGVPVAPIHMGLVPHLLEHDINTLISDRMDQVVMEGRNIRFDDSWIQRAPARAPVWDSRPSLAMDTAVIFFTSGTTGAPKLNITPSYALMERVSLLPVTGEGQASRILILPGLNSAFGFTRAAVRMHAGMTSCFATSYEAQLRLIGTFNVDTIIGSPQQIRGLIEFMDEQGTKYNAPTLRDIRIGGGFASGELIKQVQARLCRNVTIEYGSTETGLIAFARYDRIVQVGSAVGFPAPGTVVEIVDENNSPLPRGMDGLVRCRTPHFLKSLSANNPDRAGEAEYIWWYPGDIGHLTEEGILCIGGRADDVINCGGAKISAVQLDEVARRQPGVKDAGVCGVRGRSGLEEVWVGLVSDGGVDIPALIEALDLSQGFRIGVGEVLMIDQVPRNQLGKLQRHTLKEVLVGMKARPQ